MKQTGENFLELTKYPELSESDQQKELPRPEQETPEPGATLIDLPSVDNDAIPMSVQEAINRRRSLRKFSADSLSLQELAWLLWASQGVKEKSSAAGLRTVPSAGARHPFDTYLAVHNVAGLRPGLYRYFALSHQLGLIREDKDINARLTQACLGQKWIMKAAATFIWVAVPYRTTWRYSERGWRYLFLDAGHVCQNLYLACEPVQAGCCAVAAYNDDALNSLLGLDGKERFAIYLAPAGKK